MAVQLKAIADLETNAFERGIDRISGKAQQFAQGQLRSIGKAVGQAFSVYAVTNFMRATGEAADKLMDISQSFGVNVENLQTLQLMFERNGKAADDVVGVFNRLVAAQANATNNKAIAESFKRLGIDARELAQMAPDDLFMRIATAVKASGGDMQTAEAAGNLLGKTYGELQGVIDALAGQSLSELSESLKKTNQIMDEGTVAAAARMEASFERIVTTVTTSARKALVSVLGFVERVAAAIGSVSTGGTWAEGWAMPDQWNKEALSAKTNRPKAGAQSAGPGGGADDGSKLAAANAWLSEAVNGISVGPVKASDSLASIGGQIGAQANPAAQALERQVKLSEIMAKYSERIAKASEQTQKNTEALSEDS